MGANVIVSTSVLNGRLMPHIVDPKGLGNDETIREAVEYGYVIGKPEQIGYNAKGLMKSMIRSISKDGNGRKIDAFFSVQPWIRGRADDMTDELDASKVKVVAKARPLKDLRLDTSDWTVIVEGSTGNLVINSVSTGEKSGEIVIGEPIGINGFGLRLGDGDSVSWSVPGTGRSGTVAPEKLDSDMTRIDVAGNALAELADPEFNGKAIVWDLRIGACRGVKSALIRIA